MDIILFYHDSIERVLAILGMSDKMAHMQVGLAIYLGAQLALRDRRASLGGLAVLVVAEILNEMMDRLFFGSWRWDDTLADFAATVFWPGMVFAVSKYRRARWSRSRVRRGARAPRRQVEERRSEVREALASVERSRTRLRKQDRLASGLSHPRGFAPAAMQATHP